MTPREREALLKLTEGLEILLDALAANPDVRLYFDQPSTLRDALAELRQALQVEDMLP